MLGACRYESNQKVGEVVDAMLSGRNDCAAVFHRRRMMGTVSLEGLIGHPRTLEVGRVVEPVGLALSLPCTLSDAGRILDESGRQFLPVFDGPKFAGILTANCLLKHSKLSIDPVTDLPWSGALRAWGAHHMDQGREISVLFLDLPSFKNYNKDRGYGEGDDLLQRVAAAMRECLDGNLDMLARFSGDEFVIGTLRDREDAALLAQRVVRQLLVKLEEQEREAVLPAIGITGGRRTSIRPGVNIAATLDNLITRARQRCAA